MSKTNILKFSFLSLICVLCSTFLFVGCNFVSLNTPSITMQQNVLTWEKVDNASYYSVFINEEEYTTTANKFDISPYINSGEYEINVKAVKDGFFGGSSELSNTLTIAVSTEKITMPTNVQTNVENNQVYLSWEHEIATKFTVRIALKGTQDYTEFTTTSNSINITSKLTSGGEYEASVRAEDVAVLESENRYVQKQPSDYTTPITFEAQVNLTVPNNIQVADNGLVTWGNVSAATGYNVYVLGQEKAFYTDTNSINLKNVLNLYNSSDLTVVYVQAKGDSQLSLDSNWSDGVMNVSNLTQTVAKNTQLDILGNEFDLYADNQEELENIFRYSIFHRLDQIEFYVGDYVDSSSNYKGNATQKRQDAITQAINAYPEIMSLSLSISIIPSTQKLTVKLAYNDPANPTAIAQGEKTVTQDTTVQPENYATTKRASDFNNFKINEREKSMVAITSEQLFQVVQAGYKPVFIGDYSSAEMLYNIACDVLREVINDDMSDMQKVIAIYEWVCYNNVYDHNLSDRTTEIYNLMTNATDEEKTIYEQELRNYRGFYLEGMLLDNGQAVCDGIAKTFSLLCNIEGIECYKVNGSAKTGLTTGGHAWNKVKITNPVERWYCVDCTWGDNWQDNNNIIMETLSYNTMLETDYEFGSDGNSYNYHIESWPETDVAMFINEEFDNGNFDLIIDYVYELNEAINYFTENYTSFDLKLRADLIAFVNLPDGWVYKQLGGTQDNGLYVIYTFYKKA